MSTRPILFNTEMVKALLDGRKTQTRRVMKGLIGDGTRNNPIRMDLLECPYGKIGDLLYVRETFCKVDDTEHDGNQWIDYRATPSESAKHPAGWDNAPEDPDALKWKPSIHMPREASRLTLEITDISVERLQGISENDAKEEGIYKYGNERLYKIYTQTECFGTSSPIASFQSLWQSIYGADSWEDNPWVWAVEFKAHKMNVDTFLKEVTR